MGGFRSVSISLLFVVAGGCKEKVNPSPNTTPGAGEGGVAGPPAPALPADLRVELGPCDDASVSWVSGPNPHAVPGAAFASLTGTGSFSSGFDAPDTYRGGGMRGRRAVQPVTRLEQPTVTGDLDKAIIRRYLKRALPKLGYCYEKQLLVKPKLAGTVSASFTIQPDGRAADAKATGVDAEVATCVARAVGAIQFPKPRNDGTVKVSYPITFTPSDDAVVDEPPVPTTADPPAAADAGVDAAAPVGTSLLADHVEALRSCIRTQARPSGVAVVHLEPGGATEVHGIDDKAAADCIAGVTKPVKRDAATRCSLAFGTWTIATARGVDVTPTRVKYDGKDLGAQDPTQIGKIESLYVAAKAHADAAVSPGEIVSTIGPVVVRVADDASMGLVLRVLATLKMAGDLPVLAHEDGGKLAYAHPDIVLPAVPVPPGTGGSWDGPRVPVDADAVRLVVLVQEDKIWLGLSRVMEMRELDAGDLAALAAELARQKQSAHFSARGDAELGADAAVPYRQLRAVHAAMVKAGFRDVLILNPDSMTVQFSR